MKKLLIAISILALAGCADIGSEVGVTLGSGYTSRNYGSYDNYRNSDYGFYSRQRSYYPGRCDWDDVVTRDPYTQRLVCVDRGEYYRHTRAY